MVVSNPLRTRAIVQAKVKTDEIDARTLAELLAADYIPAVWQPDQATRELRRRVSHGELHRAFATVRCFDPRAPSASPPIKCKPQTQYCDAQKHEDAGGR